MITFFVGDSLNSTWLIILCLFSLKIYLGHLIMTHIDTGSICTTYNHSIYHIFNLPIDFIYLPIKKKSLILTRVGAVNTSNFGNSFRPRILFQLYFVSVEKIIRIIVYILIYSHDNVNILFE